MSESQQRASKKNVSTFPIPASLHDLERAPYDLLPYPLDFDDEDEAARADSFSALVHGLEQGNRTLSSGGLSLFDSVEDSDDDQNEEDRWMDEDRVQAMYTLVRKSTSLAPNTRTRLVSALCQALKILSSILDSEVSSAGVGGQDLDSQTQQAETAQSPVMPQTFRDAFGCHLYMLFSIMFFAESEAKVGNGLAKGSGNRSDKGAMDPEAAATRAACAEVMLDATRAVANNRKKMWQRGVPDESVVILPCRIAFQMLESAAGVMARKASSADAAMEMIAATVDSTEGLTSTVVAALMDLMHSYEHMASICAELCCLSPSNKTNPLSIELLREIGRLNTNGMAGSDTGGRASGIRNVAPFITHLATLCPRIVLNNIAHLMPHLNSEVYSLRSAIATAIAIILSSQDGLKEGENPGHSSLQNRDGPDAVKTRNALFDILTERVLDVSSFTRSAVLKAWIQVVQSGSLPVERFIPVTKLAIDRLQDKTIVVRRQSMQLLTILLENNPYMGNLDPERYRTKLAELYAFVKSNLPENIREARELAMQEADDSDEEISKNEIEQATLSAAIAEADAFGHEGELTDQQELFRNKVQALKFTQGCLDFVELFENANDAFQGMLLSKNASDVTEALRFFVKARHFKLPFAITGMKNALALLWSTEQIIRDEVRSAFVEVFIAEPGTQGKEPLPDNQIASNLLVLVGEASISELASIEEAIVSLVKDEKIPADVFLILWSIVSKGSGDAKAAAMQIISMGAGADKSIVDSKSRLKMLLDFCLEDYTGDKRDWTLTRAACKALQKVNRAVVDESSAQYLVLERIMEQLSLVARGDWCVDEDKNDTLEWFSASEEALKALFVISPSPEESCAEIIQGMAMCTFRDGHECHSLRLARFFHVLGNVSLHLLVYVEHLAGSVRKATSKKTLQKQVEADNKKVKKNQKRDSSPSQSNDDDETEDEMEAELGIAQELEAENERQMAERVEEILSRGLVNAFVPLLLRVVGNEGGRFTSEILMQASMLALCKCMCVSASFCEKQLPLLFSQLAKAPKEDTVMRANTVIALGDLAFRFPNEVEPYGKHLYGCLRDSSTVVRRHTLMVLTHLILNDMVKVKGQVCEIALCLQDDDPRIRDMAGLLFHSLANRSNNPIYNLLPDIISQLSQIDMDRESFRSIMLFLLGFIKKERQSATLTEKLTIRMAKADSISQKSDLAYCISQLKHSEKSIKALTDLWNCYKDALADEDVKKSFLIIVSKAKKTAKAELKTILEDWETKIGTHSAIGQEDAKASERATKRKKKNTKKTKKKVVDSEDEDEVDGYCQGGDVDGTDKENRRSSFRAQETAKAS